MLAHELIGATRQWAQRRADLRGVALVGSHARGDPTPESDVDFLILVESPQLYLKGHQWIVEFGKPRNIATEHWGKLSAVRVFFYDGPEVEFGFTTPDWCDVPVDPGTRRVVADGFRILHDPDSYLAYLIRACSGLP